MKTKKKISIEVQLLLVCIQGEGVSIAPKCVYFSV